MANESLNPTTPTAPGPDKGTGIDKFKSADDRDKAYLELESFSKDQARKLSELEKRLESWEVAPAPAAEPHRSFTDMYPSREQVDQQEAELASRLLTKPSEVLRKIREEIQADTVKVVGTYVSNLEAINKFKQDNPDLARHDEIVGMFVRKQDQRLAPDERLRRAAPQVRKYIADLAKTNQDKGSVTLDPNAYTEAPSGRSSPVTAAPAAKEQSEDEELSEMIREKGAWKNTKRV